MYIRWGRGRVSVQNTDSENPRIFVYDFDFQLSSYSRASVFILLG